MLQFLLLEGIFCAIFLLKTIWIFRFFVAEFKRRNEEKERECVDSGNLQYIYIMIYNIDIEDWRMKIRRWGIWSLKMNRRLNERTDLYINNRTDERTNQRIIN